MPRYVCCLTVAAAAAAACSPPWLPTLLSGGMSLEAGAAAAAVPLGVSDGDAVCAVFASEDMAVDVGGDGREKGVSGV